MEIIDLKSSSEARGTRLKKLRMLAGLSRKSMEKVYRISASTLQSWEDGKAGGLTPKGAKRVIEALAKEGVVFTLDWLLYGIGAGPKVADSVYHGSGASGAPSEGHDRPREFSGSDAEEMAISKELLAFRQANLDANDMIVMDDSMSPEYLPGDFVAGRRYYHKDIGRTIGFDCIVETAMGELLLRRVRKGTKDGMWTLVCINPNASTPMHTLYDVELLSAAPIIWRRRKDPTA